MHLVEETLLLIDRVVQLGISIRQFLAIYHQLETLCQPRLGAVHLRQRRHLDRIIGDEGRLDERPLTELAEDFVNQFPLAEALVNTFQLQFVHGDVADFFLRFAGEIEARLLLDGIEDRQPAERSLETDGLVTHLHLRFSVHFRADLLQQLLGERHHPVVVLVLHIKFHAGELRVVEAVHTLVAEVLSDFIDTFKSSDNQPLQVKLRGDTHIHIDVERIEMGDERTRARTAGNALQRRCLHLRISRLVEEAAHRAQDGGALEESILHAVVYNQVYITLAVTLLGVFKLVVCLAVLVLDDRQRLQTLRQERDFLGMNRNLAHLRLEDETLDTDEVADVEQLLEYLVV